MPFLSVDGRNVHFTDSGGDGPPLLFIHAYTTNGGLWDAMVARFAPSYRCITFDLPGHGKSDPAELPDGIASLATLTVQVLDALDIERAHVCGLSIGGMVAQHLGLDHAARVRSLTLACATDKLPDAAVALWDGRLEAIRTKGLWAQIHESMERWYGDGIMAGFGPADLDPIARMIGSTTVAGAVACGLAVKAHDVRDRVSGITAPTLVIGADKDLSFPLEHPEGLASRIDGATLVIIENAGHLAVVQQPEAFGDALGAFLARH
ncbi:MAG: alpha/beta fold hydrolase [Devosiaceae bacterium]|nr:alpha/beta fold hydrolase [Devosiaceae bacterium MH13]